MHSRIIISEKMAQRPSAISHAHRIRIIEKLYTAEQEVNSFQARLGSSHSTVSQHLSILKAKKVVTYRKPRNRAIYRLVQSELACWLLQGLIYINRGLQSDENSRSAADLESYARESKKIQGLELK